MTTPVERLFVGIALSDAVRDGVRAALRAAWPDGLPGRVVRPERWHLTLAFLGARSPAARDALVRALSDAAAGGRLGGPFTLELGGLGAFSSPRRARVLWLGARRGDTAFQALATAVGTVVTSTAGATDEAGATTATGAHRPGRPGAHLTLSRLDPPRSVDAIVACPLEVAPPLAVDAATLFRSELRRDGPRYTAIAHFPLAGRSA